MKTLKWLSVVMLVLGLCSTQAQAQFHGIAIQKNAVGPSGQAVVHHGELVTVVIRVQNNDTFPDVINNDGTTHDVRIDNIFDVIPHTGEPDEVTGNLLNGVNGPAAPVVLADFGAFVDVTHTYLCHVGDISPHIDEAFTVGVDLGTGLPVTASVQAPIIILSPAISVTKRVDPATSKAGDTVTYYIEVCNTGDQALDRVSVSDTLLGDITASFPLTLAVGACSGEIAFPYVVQGTDPDPLPNTVTATYEDSTDFDVSATASAEVDLLHPDFTVEKTCPPFSKPGDTANYEITITNTGDVALEILSADDDVAGPVPGLPAVVGVGQNLVLPYSYVVQEGDPDPLVNTVTVTAGIDPAVVVLPNRIVREDTCTTDLVHPNFTVEKLCLTDPVEGDTAQFEITITNTGDVDLTIDTDEPELAGPILLAAGQELVQVVDRPVLGGDVENTIIVIATLPEEYGLDNVIEKSASDTCTVQGNTFCSFTQGFWGNKGGKACDGTKTEDLIDDLLLLGGPVVVGQAGHSITLSTSQCIIDLLPAGGTPAVLPAGDFSCPAPVAIPGSLLNKQGRFNNVLIGQVVTLTLNVRLGALPCLPGDEPDALLGLFVLPDEPFCTVPWDNEEACAEQFEIPEDLQGLTVAELLAAANAALAGDDTYSLGDIYEAVTAINEGFDECRTIVPCVRPEICDNGCDDDGDGLVDGDDPDCL